jgi:hypothetical protein
MERKFRLKIVDLSSIELEMEDIDDEKLAKVVGGLLGNSRISLGSSSLNSSNSMGSSYPSLLSNRDRLGSSLSRSPILNTANNSISAYPILPGVIAKEKVNLSSLSSPSNNKLSPIASPLGASNSLIKNTSSTTVLSSALSE